MTADLSIEDLIVQEDMVVTVSHSGYIKRNAVSLYRAQRRGGKGLAGMQTKEEDVVTTLFVANTHTQLLFFTTDGMVYKLKTWRLPQGGRTSKGKAMVNILRSPYLSMILPIIGDPTRLITLLANRVHWRMPRLKFSLV